LDELINITTKAEERSMTQIWFRTQDLNIKTGTIQNLGQNSRLIHDPLCFQNLRIRSIYHKNPQSVRFLRPNPSIQKPIHPLLDKSTCDREVQTKDMLWVHRTALEQNWQIVTKTVISV